MKITATLGHLDKVINAIEKYRKTTIERINVLAEKVATDIAMEAANLFDMATVNVQPSGGFENVSVEVSVDLAGDVMYVIARGEEAVFVEFGSGVFYNGSAGGSPHPEGARLGMTIGDYGLGNGKKEAWAYTDNNGDIVVTRGTPAAMPMYRAMRDTANHIYEIAKGIFQ